MRTSIHPRCPTAGRRLPFWLLAPLALLLLAGAVAPTPLAAAGGAPALAEKYRDWLDLTAYIITPEERKVFLALSNDRDRDAFINIFWNQRDPTKGTPENEFKDEHIKRFQYASRYYGFTSPLPGWKTDRGRIHILLGPPVTRNEVFNSYLYPIEIWEYYGDPSKGLPTMFRIVFYRKGGAGDFKLYVPAQDGPDQLLVRQVGDFNSNNYQAIYNKINEIKPEVAEIALSLIPGEKTLNYAPSMRDIHLLSQIAELPLDNLNTTYARQFLNYRAYVNVEDSFDFLNSRHEVLLLHDPVLGMNFLHFAIWPERISVDYSDDQGKYYCSYKLVVDLKKNGRSVFQFTKTLPFSYGKDELNTALANGLILADMVPVIDGDFELTVFVQNAVNKEFSFFDERVRVPVVGGDGWAMFGPLVSYSLSHDARSSYRAYSLLDMHASPDPQRTFGQQEPVQVLFCVARGRYPGAVRGEIEVASLPAPGSEPVTRTVTAAAQGESAVQVYTAALGLLPPGYYRLTVNARDAGGVVRASGETTFSVSTLPRLPHPPVAAPTLAADKAYVYTGMLASQYENCGRAADAERAYGSALAANPANSALRTAYGRFLYGSKQYEKLLAVIAPLQEVPPSAFDFQALRGKALFQLGRYTEAVDSLLKANQAYDSDVTVLNALGLSFLRLNNGAEARKALSASLRINAQQPDIAGLLKKLEVP